MYCLFFDELLMYGCRVGGNSDMVEDQIQDLFIKLYQKQIVLTDNTKLRPFLFVRSKIGYITSCCVMHGFVRFPIMNLSLICNTPSMNNFLRYTIEVCLMRLCICCED